MGLIPINKIKIHSKLLLIFTKQILIIFLHFLPCILWISRQIDGTWLILKILAQLSINWCTKFGIISPNFSSNFRRLLSMPLESHQYFFISFFLSWVLSISRQIDETWLILKILAQLLMNLFTKTWNYFFQFFASAICTSPLLPSSF